MTAVRTRFAPSPTGYMHLGNARTALLNWLVARHHDGTFILRFEDTDLDRQVEEAEETILESLSWLGLDPDEGPATNGPHGPYRQSERAALYREYAETLLEGGAAYRCYCRQAELEARRREALERGDQPVYDGRCRELTDEEERVLREEGRVPAVRFRVDPGPVQFRDRVRGQVTIQGSEFGDFVLLRSDGRPTYNFAVVVDDVEMNVSHVIRGAGHLSNTPKQVLLYRALDATPPEFIHVPMVLGPDGSPLSKREGAPGVLDYRDEGYHPDAVVNHLSMLSWSAASGQEVLTRDELIRQVDLDRLGASDAAVDPEKMEWLSGQHIRRESPEELARRLEGFVPVERLGLEPEDLVRLARLVRGRIQRFTDARDDAETVFGQVDLEDPPVREALAGQKAVAVLQAASESVDGISEWTLDAVESAVDLMGERAGARGKAFYHPLRAALTGALHGPEIGTVLWAQGRRRAAERLRMGLERSRELAEGADPDGWQGDE